MKVSDRLAIVDKIGRELQSRYGYQEIDHYLAAFDIEPPQGQNWNSKWVYSKAALAHTDNATLARIISDLGMGTLGTAAATLNPPESWRDAALVRLFISHLSKDRLKAQRLKDCLAQYGIVGFVAHADIQPTLEWQTEIERALLTMDAMVAVHTKGFAESYWTQQEIGFALGRGTKVISLAMGEAPTGFISKHQALLRRGRKAEDVAAEIVSILASNPLIEEKIKEAQAHDSGHPWGESVPF